MTSRLEQLPPTRRLILQAIKECGATTAAELAARLEISAEAARQQLVQLQEPGWIERRNIRDLGRTGRPSTAYSLTVSGENLFPKSYDELLVTVIHAITDAFGPDAPREIWTAIANRRVRGWDHLSNVTELEERVAALHDLYVRDDHYARVERHDDGYDLVELNCPFLNAALEHPALCSTSVNMLTRVLGRRVIREERFQDGAGRCVFRVYADEIDATTTFVPEPPRTMPNKK